MADEELPTAAQRIKEQSKKSGRVVVKNGKVISGKTQSIGQKYMAIRRGTPQPGQTLSRGDLNKLNTMQLRRVVRDLGGKYNAKTTRSELIARAQNLQTAKTKTKEKQEEQVKKFEEERKKEYKEEVLKEKRPAQKLAAIQRLDRPEPIPFSTEWFERREKTPYGTPSEQLFRRRKEELAAKSMEEAYTAHYPQTTIREVKKTPEGTEYRTIRIGSQVAERETGKIPEFKELTSPKKIDKQKEESIIEQDKKDFGKIFSPIVKGYQIVDEKIKFVSQKVIPKGTKEFFYKQADVLRAQGKKPFTQSFFDAFKGKETKKFGYDPFRNVIPKESQILEFVGGALGGLREKPTQTLATVGAFFVAPPILKSAQKIIKISPIAASRIGTGLQVAYAGSVAGRVATSDRPAGALGEITTTEIAPMSVGGKAGRTFFATRKGSLYSKTYKTPIVEAEKSKVIGKKFTRGDSVVKFKYPRQMKIIETAGAQSSPVTVGKGLTTIDGRTYTIRTTQVGRKVYGSITGQGGQDIIFKKTLKGDIELKYLKPEKIDTRATRIFKKEFSKRFKTFSKEPSEASIIYKTRKIPYQPEKISLQSTKRSKAFTKGQLDVGIKLKGGEQIFPKRVAGRLGVYKLKGKTEEFTKLRDVKKIFVGKATTTLTQKDIATPQKEFTQIDGTKVLKFTQPDIKYALQPTLKPNIKIYATDMQASGIIKIEKYVKKPTLTTKKITKFESEQFYGFSRSRLKPEKEFARVTKEMMLDRSAYVGGRLKRKAIQVTTKTPKIKPGAPQRQPTLTEMEIVNILKPVSKSKTIYLPFSLTRTPSKIKTKPKTYIRTKPQTRTRIENIIKLQPKIQPKLEPKIRSRIKTTSKTRTIQRTITRTPTTTRTPISSYISSPLPPPPPPPTPPPQFIFSLDDSIKKKRKKSFKSLRVGRYQPQIRAVYGNIRLKTPRLLTGIGFERGLRL